MKRLVVFAALSIALSGCSALQNAIKSAPPPAVEAQETVNWGLPFSKDKETASCGAFAANANDLAAKTQCDLNTNFDKFCQVNIEKVVAAVDTGAHVLATVAVASAPATGGAGAAVAGGVTAVDAGVDVVAPAVTAQQAKDCTDGGFIQVKTVAPVAQPSAVASPAANASPAASK